MQKILLILDKNGNINRDKSQISDIIIDQYSTNTVLQVGFDTPELDSNISYIKAVFSIDGVSQPAKMLKPIAEYLHYSESELIIENGRIKAYRSGNLYEYRISQYETKKYQTELNFTVYVVMKDESTLDETISIPMKKQYFSKLSPLELDEDSTSVSSMVKSISGTLGESKKYTDEDHFKKKGHIVGMSVTNDSKIPLAGAGVMEGITDEDGSIIKGNGNNEPAYISDSKYLNTAAGLLNGISDGNIYSVAYSADRSYDSDGNRTLYIEFEKPTFVKYINIWGNSTWTSDSFTVEYLDSESGIRKELKTIEINNNSVYPIFIEADINTATIFLNGFHKNNAININEIECYAPNPESYFNIYISNGDIIRIPVSASSDDIRSLINEAIGTNTESIMSVINDHKEDLNAHKNLFDNKIDKSKIGIDIASLENGKIPSSQLPSFVDDIIECYYNESDKKIYKDAEFNEVITGEAGKIYLDIRTSLIYRWSGSQFILVGNEAMVLGEVTGTAYDGGKGKDLADKINNIINPLSADTLKVAYARYAEKAYGDAYSIPNTYLNKLSTSGNTVNGPISYNNVDITQPNHLTPKSYIDKHFFIKENITSVSGEVEITGSSNKEYIIYSEIDLSSLSVNIEASAITNPDYGFIIDFETGESAPSFSSFITSNDGQLIIYGGDDCYKGLFTPMPKRLYEINYKNINGKIIARVGGVDI